MNYIKHLTGFFDRIIKDSSLNPTHISLYLGLFQYWNVNRFKNPISITRDEVMRISKICSKATYHKCIRELNDKGYLKYEPSYNPFKGSMVFMFNFSEDLKPVQKKEIKNKKILPVNKQVLNKQDTTTEQALVSSINSINNTNTLNILNLEEQSQNFENKSLGLKKENEEKKLRQKKKNSVTPSAIEKPTIEEVKKYFQEQNHPDIEAQKFYNYFSSNGWLVGGKTKMVDWRAAAGNWILNSLNFKHNTDTSPTNRAKHLNSPTNKNYSEPL
ncbi:transcriptional regulator [Lutibacter aestuarii]|uniref:Transcriptional regulator n=1 Tax=Lutibacter aestuarii TaxID=861111 RepID=A0ABW2Z8P2_9FLAO